MSEGIVLSQQGLKKLQEELERLKHVRRAEVAARIALAKEFGDLSENADYHDAKEEQAFVEGRIAEIEHMLMNANVVEGHSGSEIGVGSRVTLVRDGADMVYEIVGATEADPASGRISIDSPLGQALIGKASGDQVLLNAPSGSLTYRIKNIE